MGTNYYHHEKPPCPTCGHEGDEPRHIGKSSAGWCFSLHVHPEDGINNLADWKARWAAGIIKDEYGDTITAEDMEHRITRRGRPTKGKPLGYANWTDFHARNYSEPGPENLLRHQIDGRRCIGHGEGTWDLLVGEFC
jgi:hypothetical protein